MAIRDQEFVEAAIATGSSSFQIIFKHILPNTMAPVIVESTLRLGVCILAISSLSFIGLVYNLRYLNGDPFCQKDVSISEYFGQ
jgi:peptide/nickel transport system permease protein